MQLPWFHKKATADTQEGLDAAQEVRLATEEAQAEEEEEEDEEEWDDDEEWEEDEDDLDEILQEVYEWGQEWSKTPAFEALPKEQKDESEFILMSFTEYMYTYHEVTPEEWNADDMEDCCLYTLTRKITAEEAYYRSIAPVLASFFNFLDRTQRLRNAARMVKRILSLDQKIVDASNDPRNWGMAKSLAMAAQAEGVDFTDQKAMDAFIVRYNTKIMGQTMPAPAMAYPKLPSADRARPGRISAPLRPVREPGERLLR